MTAFDYYVGIGEARGEERGEARGKATGERSARQSILLRLGRKRFGEPYSVIVDILKSIDDLERLDRLADAILNVKSWPELLATLWPGVKVVHSMTVYDFYEAVGEARADRSVRRSILLRLGRNRFGEPGPANVAALNSIDDLDRLDRLVDAILSAKSWSEFLATP